MLISFFLIIDYFKFTLVSFNQFCSLKNQQLIVNLYYSQYDFSWYTRLKKNNKRALAMLNLSLLWLSFIQKNKLLSSCFLFLLFFRKKYLKHRRFFTDRLHSLKKLQAFSDNTKKAYNDKPSSGFNNPDPKSEGLSCIKAWLNKCIDLFGQNKFSLLEAQFALFVPLIRSNKVIFEKGFSSLTAENLLQFCSLLVFLNKMRSAHNKNKKAAQIVYKSTDFDYLFCVFLKSVQTKMSYMTTGHLLKKELSCSLTTLLLDTNTCDLSLTKKQANLLLKCLWQQNALQVLTLLSEKITEVALQPQLNKLKIEKLTYLILNLYKPEIRWFVVEQLGFWLTQNLFIGLFGLVDPVKQCQVLSLLVEHNGDFSIAFSFLRKQIISDSFKPTTFWVVLLFILFYSEPAHAYDANSWAFGQWSSFTLAPIFCFNGLKKTRRLSFLSKAANSINNQTASDTTTELTAWIHFNQVKLVNQILLDNLGPDMAPYIAPYMLLPQRNLKVPLAEPSEIMVDSYQKINDLTTVLKDKKSITAQKFFTSLWLELANRDGALKSLGFKASSTYSKDENFEILVISFFETLVPNADGYFSLCGTIYPYSYREAICSLYNSCFRVLEKGTLAKGLLAYISQNKARVTELGKVELAHLFPKRLTTALNYDHDDFLGIFLPKELNQPIDSAIYGQYLWFCTNLVYESFLANLTTTLRLNLTQSSAFTEMISHSFFLVWESKKNELQEKDSMFSALENFSNTQFEYIGKSYLAGMQMYCENFPDRMPTQNLTPLVSFPTQLQDLIGLKPEPYVSIQERILHKNALEIVKSYFNESILKLMVKNLRVIYFTNLEDYLISFSKSTSFNRAEFFENQAPEAQEITAKLVAVIRTTVRNMLFSYVAALSFLSLFALSTKQIKTIKTASFGSDLESNKQFSKEMEALLEYPSDFNKYKVITIKCESINSNMAKLPDYIASLLTAFLAALDMHLSQFDEVINSAKRAIPKGLRWVGVSIELSQPAELKVLKDFQEEFLSYVGDEIKEAIELEIRQEAIKNHFISFFKLVNLWLNQAAFPKEISLKEINVLLEKANVDFAFDLYNFQYRDGKFFNFTLEDLILPVEKTNLAFPFFDTHIFLFSINHFREVFSVRAGYSFMEFIYISKKSVPTSSNQLSPVDFASEMKESARELFEKNGAGKTPLTLAETSSSDNVGTEDELIKPSGFNQPRD